MHYCPVIASLSLSQRLRYATALIRVAGWSLACPNIKLQAKQSMPLTCPVSWLWSVCHCFPLLFCVLHIAHAFPCVFKRAFHCKSSILYLCLLSLSFTLSGLAATYAALRSRSHWRHWALSLVLRLGPYSFRGFSKKHLVHVFILTICHIICQLSTKNTPTLRQGANEVGVR